jgi:hypothetical protein
VSLFCFVTHSQRTWTNCPRQTNKHCTEAIPTIVNNTSASLLQLGFFRLRTFAIHATSWAHDISLVNVSEVRKFCAHTFDAFGLIAEFSQTALRSSWRVLAFGRWQRRRNWYDALIAFIYCNVTHELRALDSGNPQRALVIVRVLAISFLGPHFTPRPNRLISCLTW